VSVVLKLVNPTLGDEMKNMVFGVLLIMASKSVLAGWNNTSGTVSSINNYAHTDTVLIKLSSLGEDVEACGNKDTFAIDGALPESRRNQIYSALLAAKASGKSVTLAYDDTGNCIAYGSNPSAYRGIVRIIH
jgi:hypothetical protein